jgi:adenosylcobinamide-phosphate synthase
MRSRALGLALGYAADRLLGDPRRCHPVAGFGSAALGYRAANTLDAMVGHRNDRYLNFGWASARFDDLVNLAGSRLAGLLALAAQPSRAAPAGPAWRRDAAAHPSPNAGVVEAAFAGALGIRLGGINRYYGDRIEHRAVMGDGRAAQQVDITRATQLARRVGLGGAAATAVAAALFRRGR